MPAETLEEGGLLFGHRDPSETAVRVATAPRVWCCCVRRAAGDEAAKRETDAAAQVELKQGVLRDTQGLLAQRKQVRNQGCSHLQAVCVRKPEVMLCSLTSKCIGWFVKYEFHRPRRC